MNTAIQYWYDRVKENFEKEELIERLREDLMQYMEKQQHPQEDKDIQEIADSEGLTLDSTWSYVEDWVSDILEEIIKDF